MPKLITLVLVFASFNSFAVRTDLHLFQYSLINRDKTEGAFVNFQDLLAEKLPKLSSESKNNEQLEGYEKLQLVIKKHENGEMINPNDLIPNLAERENYWLNTNILAFLTGRVDVKNGIPFVKTQFFWGELHGVYGEKAIPLELPITGDAFDNTNDSHSVAVLLALANDLSGCGTRMQRVKLLNAAYKKANSLALDNIEIGQILVAIIDDSIKELKNECS